MYVAQLLKKFLLVVAHGMEGVEVQDVEILGEKIGGDICGATSG